MLSDGMLDLRSRGAHDDRQRDENQFLATLAHELRNLLAPMRNTLEILRLGKDDRQTVEKARLMIERQTQQMVRLMVRQPASQRRQIH